MGSNTYPAPGRRARSPHAREVLDAIRRIVQALRESSRLAERHAGLSGAQLFVLRTLAESPGVSLNTLSERTRTHQSSVSVVVAKLVQHRLVEKRTAAGDARRAEIRLSAAGRRRFASAPQMAQERLVAAVDGLPAAERRQLATTLEGLARAMALPRKRPAMFFEESARHRRIARPHD
jgi:DNA-binding MarR family transcriptional regulator